MTDPQQINQNVLFIGGVADGQRAPDPEAKYWQMAEEPPACRVHLAPDLTPISALRTYVYRREALQIGEDRIVFYVKEGIDLTRAILRVFNHYQP